MSNQATFLSAFNQFLAIRETQKDAGEDAETSVKASSQSTIPETPTEASKYL